MGWNWWHILSQSLCQKLVKIFVKFFIKILGKKIIRPRFPSWHRKRRGVLYNSECYDAANWWDSNQWTIAKRTKKTLFLYVQYLEKHKNDTPPPHERQTIRVTKQGYVSAELHSIELGNVSLFNNLFLRQRSIRCLLGPAFCCCCGGGGDIYKIQNL